MTSGLQKQQIAGIMGGVAAFAAALFLGINNAPASAQAESSQCVHVLPGTVSLWPAVDPLDAAQPILTDTFDDGIISPPWEVFDNITPSGGTFSASETNGKLTFSVSGGINFQQNAGVAYSVSSAPSEFSVSAAVAANFGGSSGNKRGQLVVRDAAGNVAALQLGDDGGSSFKWQAFSSASSAFGGYGNYTDGTPVMFTIVKSGSTMTYFVDGSLVYSETTPFLSLATVALQTVAANNSDLHTITYDDVKILDVPFGPNTAVDVVDGNHGTLQNGAMFATGRIGQGFILDGVDDHIRVPDASNLDMTGDLSIAAWISPDDTSAFRTIAVKGEFTNDVYQLSLWDGTVFFRVRTTAGDNYVRSVNTVPVGQWSNVIGVREGNLLKVYINGAQDPTTTAVFGAGLTEHLGLKIGFHLPSSPNAFKGLVDEVGIFNRALSSNEIQDLQHWQRWDVRSCHGS